MSNVVKLKKDRQGPDAATAPRDASPELVAARAYLNTMIELGQVISHRKKVDPALAAAMLERNQGNVSLVPADIAKYAKDMADSKWYDTGDPFAFSTDGILINGQHRAKAIIRSGVTIEAMVQFGNDPKTRFVSDTGRANTSARILAAHGYTGAATKLRIAQFVRRISENLFDENGNSIRLKSSNEDAVSELSKFSTEELTAAYRAGARLKRKFSRPGIEAFGALYILFARHEDVAASMFFEALMQGKGQGFSGDGDPAFLVHRRLHAENNTNVRRANSNVSGRGMSSTQTICAIMIKGFNLYAAGKQTNYLTWLKDGHPGNSSGQGKRPPEPFPTIGSAVTDDDGEE